MGEGWGEGDPATLAGSEYLEVLHGLVAGRPSLDLALEARVQRACLRLVREGVVRSAHDCSDGGLAVALAESAIAGGIGFHGDFQVTGRWDAALFGEAQSRIVVSVAPDRLPDLQRIASEEGVPWLRLGVVGGNRFTLVGLVDMPAEEAAKAWKSGLQ